jgi:hypothetical protein
MSLVGTGTVRVEMPDGDWYELKEALGFRDRKRQEIEAFAFRVPDDALGEDGKVDKAKIELVSRQADADFMKIKVRLVAWSHTEPITDANVARIMPHHAEALLAKIEELEQAEQPFRGEPGASGED